MQELKRVGVGSAAKVSGILSLIFGLIVGIVFAFVTGLGPETVGVWSSWPVQLIGWPIVYGLLGVIFGAIYAALYNVVVRWVGGIRIEIG